MVRFHPGLLTRHGDADSRQPWRMTMARQVKYVQCVLERKIAKGLVKTTTYIPHQYASVGRVLKLRDDLDRWVDGWKVVSVGVTIVDSADVPDYRKAIRNHRKLTGDSQPRLKK